MLQIHLLLKLFLTNANDSILKWKQGREFDYMAYLDSLLRKEKDLRIDTVSIDKGIVNKKQEAYTFSDHG